MKHSKLIPLALAAKMLPRPPSPQTLWRWRTRGVNNVRLECVRCGQHWYTTVEFLDNFLAAQSAADKSHPVHHSDRGRDASMSSKLRSLGLLPEETSDDSGVDTS